MAAEIVESSKGQSLIGQPSRETGGAASRYADALFDLASEAGATEAVEADLKALSAMIAGSAEFSAFIASPVLGAEDMSRAIAAIAERARFTPLTANFLGVVARNRRLFFLRQIIAAFIRRLADSRGEVAAEAIAAAPLNDDQMKRLRGEIEGVVGRAVNLTVSVDPELLGGLIVKIGSTMIDSSLRNKLNRLRAVMKEA